MILWAFADPPARNAWLTTAPLLEDTGLPLALMGIAVVFAALVLVALFIAALPRVLRYVAWVFPEKDPSAELGARATDAVEAPLIAAIAAALHRYSRNREQL